LNNKFEANLFIIYCLYRLKGIFVQFQTKLTLAINRKHITKTIRIIIFQTNFILLIIIQNGIQKTLIYN